MRVLFTVSSWATHWSSMVPAGWALQAAGHEVRVLCPPSMTDPLGRAGLIPVPVLGGQDVVTSNRLQYYHEAVAGLWPYPWLPLHPVTGAPMSSLTDFDVEDDLRVRGPRVIAQARRSFDSAVDFAGHWRPDLVLQDPANLEGLLVARLLEVPWALCLWGPVGTHEPEHMRIVPEDPSDAFGRFGLGTFHLDMLDRVVDPCPDSVAPPVTGERLPVRYLPYNGSAPPPSLPAPAAGRPRVCVAWSTALSTMSGPQSYLLPMLVTTLAAMGCEVLVTATAEDAEKLGPVPDGVRVLIRVPLRLVLPTCSAVVHHGGSGNTMTAIWAGVPQLAVTFASEQCASAERVAAAGAAVHLPGHAAAPDTVRAAVDALLTVPSYRSAAAGLRDELLSRPSPADLAGTLTRLADAVPTF